MSRWLALVLLVLTFGTIIVTVIGLTGWLVAEILIARGVDPVVAWVGGMSLSALGWCWWWFSDENQEQ